MRSLACRPIFRVFAILLSAPLICLGVLALFDYGKEDGVPDHLQSDLRLAHWSWDQYSWW